jgi:hypothetical protein
MKKSIEIQEAMEEIKNMLEDVINPADTIIEIEDEDIIKAADFKEEDEDEEDDEEISKNYNSDNEDEDKWDNMEKACWSGYEQQGMKDKNGRKVPNCVPVKKSADNDEDDKKVVEKESPWGGAFRPIITK